MNIFASKIELNTNIFDLKIKPNTNMFGFKIKPNTNIFGFKIKPNANIFGLTISYLGKHQLYCRRRHLGIARKGVRGVSTLARMVWGNFLGKNLLDFGGV